MLFISPPFGNYIDYATPIRGSFTLERRPGLLMRIVQTLRYSFNGGGWVNKIGLRNNGLQWALSNYSTRDILSVAILKKSDIPLILHLLPTSQNIEINVSCPNLNTDMVSHGLGQFINAKRRWCILKLSPLATISEIDKFYRVGFRQFHCSNTLPTLQGGLSGPTLIPYTTFLIQRIRKKYGVNVEIIAGGGVRDIKTAQHYINAGADHISVSTLCFSPLLFWKFIQKFE